MTYFFCLIGQKSLTDHALLTYATFNLNLATCDGKITSSSVCPCPIKFWFEKPQQRKELEPILDEFDKLWYKIHFSQCNTGDKYPVSTYCNIVHSQSCCLNWIGLWLVETELWLVVVEKPRDCADIQQDGFRSSGVFNIHPEGATDPEGVEVFCDLHTDGGGWLVSTQWVIHMLTHWFTVLNEWFTC